MTAQEAMESLKYMISDDCTDTQSDFIDEIELAISALEKQIPKKPIEDAYFDDPCVCPICGASADYYTQPNYCYHCGQKISWERSDTE